MSIGLAKQDQCETTIVEADAAIDASACSVTAAKHPPLQDETSTSVDDEGSADMIERHSKAIANYRWSRIAVLKKSNIQQIVIAIIVRGDE